MESAETGLIHLVNLPFLGPWLLNPFNYVNKVDLGHYFYNRSMRETNPVSDQGVCSLQSIAYIFFLG